jgi:hypothetical protein
VEFHAWKLQVARNGPSNKERNTIKERIDGLQYIDENCMTFPEYDEEIAKLFKATVALMTNCQSDDFMGEHSRRWVYFVPRAM